MNRRQFFTNNFKSAVGFLGEMIAPAIEQERTFIRPPGTEDELVFLTQCTRCGICADVCPESTIKLFSVAKGAKLAGTPYLNPNEIPCTFCYKCIDHCPTDALERSNPKNVAKIGVAEIVQDNCLAYRDVMCDYCVRSCPVGKSALSLRGGKPYVSSQFCTGCGECVVACIQDSKGIFVKPLKSQT